MKKETQKRVYYVFFKSSLFMKILSISITLLCIKLFYWGPFKYIVVVDTKKFGSKVDNRQYFHMKISLSKEKLSINNFTTKLPSTF